MNATEKRKRKTTIVSRINSLQKVASIVFASPIHLSKDVNAMPCPMLKRIVAISSITKMTVSLIARHLLIRKFPFLFIISDASKVRIIPITALEE